MRRFLMFCAAAAFTATATLYWLHDGDLAEAVRPVVAEWNADLLVQEAGLGDLTGTEPAPVDAEAHRP